MRFKSTSFKLTSCLLLLVSATGLAYAKGPYRNVPDFKCEVPSNPCPCPPSLMDGFYFGGDVGYDIITSRARFDRSGNILLHDSFVISGNPRLAATGWDGGLFAGYGKYFGCDCNFYLGGEIWGNWSSASDSLNITTPNGNAHFRVRANGDVGIGILPGIKLNHATLGYLRLGYDWGRVKSNGNITVFTPAPLTFSNSGNNNNQNGWVVGFGLESLIVDNWSLRAEADYLSFNNNNSSGSSDFGSRGSRERPNDYRFTLGVNYHFCF
jgi:outer membrane immunogenic protein